MLQMNNLDESKSEWDQNVSHILIPLTNENISDREPDKIDTSSNCLNAFDNSEELTVLTNGAENSLVIGLDKNLFENHTCLNDLLLIQNSELKLLQCNSDLKNSIACTLSFIDHNKSEIRWEGSFVKDKAKPELCSNDKAIYEVKEVLNFENSLKNLHNDLVKSGDHLNLGEVEGYSTEIAKVNGGVLIQVEEPLSEDKALEVEESLGKDKNIEVEKKAHYIVNYYPSIQNYEMISVLPSSIESSKQKCIIVKHDSLFSNKSSIHSNIKQSKSLLVQNEPPILLNKQNSLIFNPRYKSKKYSNSAPIVENFEQQIIKKFKHMKHLKSKPGKVQKSEKTVFRVSSFLQEKSLPLKKKAKMKRSLALFRPDATRPKNETLACSKEKSEMLVSDIQEHFSSNSDSDEPLIKKVVKKEKQAKLKFKFRQTQSKSKLMVNELSQEIKPIELNCNIDGSKLTSNEIVKIRNLKYSKQFEEEKFNSVFDLIEELKKRRFINKSVWEILNSGLKEMNVDILKEMKCNPASTVTGCQCYSVQLKAFALMLYFKQPAAFNYVAKLYKTRWPSLNIIKDWKRRLNSHSRPNFIGLDEE